MVVLTDLLSPRLDRTWRLAKQCGVNDVFTLLDGGEQDRRMFASVGAPASRPSIRDDAPWSASALRRHVADYQEYGLRVVGVEDNPPLDQARLGLAGRDEEIDAVITQVRAMGELGIGVLCYNWMALTSWARTQIDRTARGGALVTAYDSADESELASLSDGSSLNVDTLWDSLDYFLSAVLPVAEQSGVRLALHPDDPPRPQVRGVARIIGSADAYRRLILKHPSQANAITFCQGNFALMSDDMPALIAEFAADDRIAFSHFRHVRGTSDRFEETFHDESEGVLSECMRAYLEAGFAGPMRADHVPTMDGEANTRPGYGALGRLFAVGYMRGMLHGMGASSSATESEAIY